MEVGGLLLGAPLLLLVPSVAAAEAWADNGWGIEPPSRIEEADSDAPPAPEPEPAAPTGPDESGWGDASSVEPTAQPSEPARPPAAPSPAKPPPPAVHPSGGTEPDAAQSAAEEEAQARRAARAAAAAPSAFGSDTAAHLSRRGLLYRLGVTAGTARWDYQYRLHGAVDDPASVNEGTLSRRAALEGGLQGTLGLVDLGRDGVTPVPRLTVGWAPLEPVTDSISPGPTPCRGRVDGTWWSVMPGFEMQVLRRLVSLGMDVGLAGVAMRSGGTEPSRLQVTLRRSYGVAGRIEGHVRLPVGTPFGVGVGASLEGYQQVGERLNGALSSAYLFAEWDTTRGEP